MNITRVLQRSCLAFGLLGFMIFSCHAVGQGNPSELRPIPPDDLPVPDEGTRIIAEGMLLQAIDAYKKAPVVKSKTSVKISSGENSQEMAVEVIFGPDKSLRLVAPESQLVVKDGWLNIVMDSVYDRYLRVPAGESVTDAIEGVMGDRFAAGYEIMMRDGEPLEIVLDVLTMRSVINPRITGLEIMNVGEEGERTLSRIHIAGYMGSGFVDYDQEQKKIIAVQSEMYPLEGIDGFTWTMEMNIEVEFLEKLPKPIEFDPGIRTPVSSREQLDPIARNSLSIGQAVPALKLPQLNGPEVDLADLRGKIVVLEFWSTWSRAAEMSMPNFQKLYLEYGKNTGDVQVYAVDMLERVPRPIDRIEAVSNFWKKGGYTLPTLISMDDSFQVAWGITSTPLCIIVAPDGTVAQMFKAYSSDQYDKIKAVIKQLETD